MAVMTLESVRLENIEGRPKPRRLAVVQRFRVFVLLENNDLLDLCLAPGITVEDKLHEKFGDVLPDYIRQNAGVVWQTM